MSVQVFLFLILIVATLVNAENTFSKEKEDLLNKGPYDKIDGFFQYVNVPDDFSYETGWNRGNPWHHVSRYEQLQGNSFRTKVKWGDAYEGYGEHYWDYNHGSSSHKSYPKSYKSKATTYSESSENFNYDTPSNQPKPTVAYQEYPELSAPIYHTIGRYQKGIESIGGSSDESDPLHQVPVYKPAPVYRTVTKVPRYHPNPEEKGEIPRFQEELPSPGRYQQGKLFISASSSNNGSTSANLEAAPVRFQQPLFRTSTKKLQTLKSKQTS